MSAPADFPGYPLSLSIDQFSPDGAHVFVNGVNLAMNIRKDSLSVRLNESRRIEVSLTFVVDDFSHKGFPLGGVA